MKNIKNNKKKLIIISIILFLFAISTTIVITTKGDLGKDDATKANSKENANNKNPNDSLGKVINDDEKKDKNIDINNEEKKDDNDKANETNDPKSDNNVSDNNSNVDRSEIVDKPEANSTTPSVIEDKNNIKRRTMESTYGIKILYGDEIGNYNPKGITPIKLTNSSEIDNYLNRLNTELAKYPQGFFNDFNKKGMPLTIYLIKSVNGAFSGFTDYQFMNNIKLTLTADYNFEYTVHHELMHYIDCYLDIVMYPNNPYTEYEALNPSGFVYGGANSSQIYNMASNQRGAYFISSYGATHVREDRAEVFKYMIARAYKPIGCFEPNEIIRRKAEVISRQIKIHFPSVVGTAHWDRFIS